MDIQGLLLIVFLHHTAGTAVQRVDGWYNNLAHPSWGSAGEPLIHNITTAYGDYTYQCMKNGRPSARQVSNDVFRQDMSVDNEGSIHNRSALFAFFGQVVSFELTDTDENTCPAEMLAIPVPKCDPDFDRDCTGKVVMPFERSAYDKETGQSPNSPRRQINHATSFIDGSFVYGTNTVRANFVRHNLTAFLACGDEFNKYPEINRIGVPYKTYPNVDGRKCNHNALWTMGDPHVHENPALLSIGVLFFRYHNIIAQRFIDSHPQWTSTKVFFMTRRWVIASLQNIIMYDWLPKFLQKDVKPYSGYKSSTEPGISSMFDAAAIKFLMTLIPSSIQQRYKNTCEEILRRGKPKVVRLCNSYFNSQDLITSSEHGVEETLLGLASQKAEKEDIFVVEDLQSKWYGPLHFSKRDFVAHTIMRGRDHGLPDYNTIRREMRMSQKKTFEDINPELNRTNPEIFAALKKSYETIDLLDVFVGGMLETTDGKPGELFTNIIMDQFEKIREGDRFWFENPGLFTDAEINQIRNITLHDIIMNSTNISPHIIQKDVFTIHEDDFCKPLSVRFDMLENCTEHKGYDYFSGSEICYIIVWTCFGLIPLVCILVAYIYAKLRTWHYNRETRKRQSQVIKRNDHSDTENRAEEISYHALEWLGKDAEPRPVIVKIKPKCQLEMCSSRGSKIRLLHLDSSDTVEVWTSTNKGRTTLVIKVPKEYDMVLQFQDYVIRTSFEKSLKENLAAYDRTVLIHEDKLKVLRKKAFTQTKRNAALEVFFKQVFSEAFQMDYDPSLDDNDSITSQTTEDILQIELTKEEFAQAMAVKPNSEFVENMFGILDSDRNGYISFRDFLNAVVLFSKGSCQEKLRLVFRMFDIEERGFLNKQQLITMFRSLLEMANSNLSKDELVNLVESICVQNGLTDQSHINFEDFCQILSPQMDQIWNAGLEWKGRKNCYPSPERKKRKLFKKQQRRNFYAVTDAGRRRSSVTASLDNLRRKSSASTEDLSSQRTQSSGNLTALEKQSTTPTRFEATREKYDPIKAKMRTIGHFIENNRQHIFYLVIFYGITFGLFAERFYFYTVEREHDGLRSLMSYGISVTRGAAGAMSFTFSLLLLTMCRNLITWLRGTILNLYIPFDSHVAFHKVVAWTALFFTGFHVIGYSFNFYHLATQPTGHLCIFDSIVLRSDVKLTFSFWLFGNMTGFTGVLLVIIIYVIYVFATQTARRYIFNAFWWTHKLIVILYVLTIIHGASRIVQRPNFHVYFVVPAILFTIDKMISLSRKKTEITVIRAEKLPSDITYLEFKRPSRFEYKSGQWVRIACLSHGKNEYHPFTLTSSPHEDTLSLHIRALGPWTWNIRQLFDPDNLKEDPYPKLYLDGPYGAGQQDWYQYEVSVLVGAGIGVTPYASILKDFIHMSIVRSTYRMKCQKLYFVWITASQRHYEWLLDIIREVEDVDEKGIVSTDIFITQFFQNFDLRTSMLYICEEHFQKLSGGCSVFTGLKASTHFGRPKLNEMFQAVHRAHPMVRKVGVFSCGPPGVTKNVERSCIEASNSTKALFEHHFENF